MAVPVLVLSGVLEGLIPGFCSTIEFREPGADSLPQAIVIAAGRVRDRRLAHLLALFLGRRE